MPSINDIAPASQNMRWDDIKQSHELVENEEEFTIVYAIGDVIPTEYGKSGVLYIRLFDDENIYGVFMTMTGITQREKLVNYFKSNSEPIPGCYMNFLRSKSKSGKQGNGYYLIGDTPQSVFIQDHFPDVSDTENIPF